MSGELRLKTLNKYKHGKIIKNKKRSGKTP